MPQTRERKAGQVLTVAESRDLRRSLLGWLVVVVVLVTVVTTVFNWVFVERDPQDPVDAWLGGIEDGRSRQLLAGAEAVVADPTLSVVPNRVYRAAAGRIDGHEILGVDVQGDHAEIAVRIRWDEPGPDGLREEVHVYGVHRVERSGPLNDKWELDSPDTALLSVHLPAVLDELSVNGRTLRLDADESVPHEDGPGAAWRFQALPGTYVIGLPDDSYYELARPLAPPTLALRDPEPVSVELSIAPSPRMWREVDQRIEERIEQCMSSDELVPEGCPASLRHAPEPGRPSPSAVATATGSPAPAIERVQWRLVSRPALVLVPLPGEPLRWSALPYRQAEAQVSYLEDGERVAEHVRFPVRATVHSTGQSAEISVALE